MSFKDDIAEIEARAKLASPGPWRNNDGTEIPFDASGKLIFAPYEYGPVRDEDEAFFLAARTDVPVLLEMVHQLISVFAPGRYEDMDALWAEAKKAAEGK